ncbi:MAG: hypothetical protein GF416_02955 [Candidatus Altiarchaeales archaeon]|nr:hypothetical protein [Candidatus Altiarchaeales archaeon]MBD3416079.1 hypothetical protein [Candidatus Altiarchaeales archaeon]
MRAFLPFLLVFMCGCLCCAPFDFYTTTTTTTTTLPPSFDLGFVVMYNWGPCDAGYGYEAVQLYGDGEGYYAFNNTVTGQYSSNTFKVPKSELESLLRTIDGSGFKELESENDDDMFFDPGIDGGACRLLTVYDSVDSVYDTRYNAFVSGVDLPEVDRVGDHLVSILNTYGGRTARFTPPPTVIVTSTTATTSSTLPDYSSFREDVMVDYIWGSCWLGDPLEGVVILDSGLAGYYYNDTDDNLHAFQEFTLTQSEMTYLKAAIRQNQFFTLDYDYLGSNREESHCSALYIHLDGKRSNVQVKNIHVPRYRNVAQRLENIAYKHKPTYLPELPDYPLA